MSTGRGLRHGLLAALACCVCLGCAAPHYVIKNPDGGVIAIAEDTPELRAKAEKLMREHLPAGYVIEDVSVVPLGRPYRTYTQIGPIVEVERHQRTEVMLTYRATPPPGTAPVQTVVAPAHAPVVQTTAYTTPAERPPARVPPTKPVASAETQAAGLPPEPLPAGN